MKELNPSIRRIQGRPETLKEKEEREKHESDRTRLLKEEKEEFIKFFVESYQRITVVQVDEESMWNS